YIVATGRGDFPNQVNNSLGFPGILKGALLVQARKITDEMAIVAAYSMANYAEKKGISADNIMPKMDDTEMFAYEAADVAMEAIKNGVARVQITWDEVFNRTMDDIKQTRDTIDMMMKNNFIPEPDSQMLEDALKVAVDAVT
nr:hypothetical protein [Bacteroidales bacterium]